MIYEAADFSRREYNALLECGNLRTDSWIADLVWQIIFYSQKKSEDDLVNGDKEHTKWFWYDSNDVSSDWMWRKYNVTICMWISTQYSLFISSAKNAMTVSIKECKEKFENDHKQSKKSTRSQPIPENKADDEDDDDEKKESVDI